MESFLFCHCSKYKHQTRLEIETFNNGCFLKEDVLISKHESKATLTLPSSLCTVGHASTNTRRKVYIFQKHNLRSQDI